MSDCPSGQKYIKIAAFILLAAIGVLIHFLEPTLYATLFYLATSGDIEAIAQTLRSYGAWAMVASLVVDILINIPGFLPSVFISAANGVVFGIVPGIIISWLGESIGVIISFYLVRTFFRKSAEQLIVKSQHLKKIDEFSGVNGFKVMLVTRSIPYFPSGVVTVLGALSSISFKDYALATLIGKLPPVALEVVVGYDIVNYKENMARLAIAVLAAVVVYGWLWWRKQKKLRQEHL